MNADRLLQAISKVGDDPARIQQLRKVVVALAVAGKLQPDSATLRPQAMLSAIEQVKAKLRKQQAIPKAKKLKEIDQADFPEGFPRSAPFARLSEVARVEKGMTGIKQAQPGAFPLVVTGAERASCDHFDFEGAAAIVPLVSSTGHGHASLNRLHYQEGKFALGTILVAIFPYDPSIISARFIFEYLSAFKEELLVARMTGTANVTLSVGQISEIPVPLTDPSIRAKVDELMALLDRLEAARAEREAARDRLTAASLIRLTAPADPETARAHARFALAALPALTTRPDQIRTLRQTILNLAVRGKLVDGAAGKSAPVGQYRKLQNGYAFKSEWFTKSGTRLLRNANVGHGDIRWEDTVCLPNSMAGWRFRRKSDGVSEVMPDGFPR